MMTGMTMTYDPERGSVTEDGIVVSQNALTKFAFETFEKRVVKFGVPKWPLNLYEALYPDTKTAEVIRKE